MPLRVAWNSRKSKYSPGFTILFDLQFREPWGASLGGGDVRGILGRGSLRKLLPRITGGDARSLPGVTFVCLGMAFQKYLLKPMKSHDCASRSGLELVKISILARFCNTCWSPVPPRDSACVFHHIRLNHDVWKISTKTYEISWLCLAEWSGIDENLNIS